jgi:hypothetical protein
MQISPFFQRLTRLGAAVGIITSAPVALSPAEGISTNDCSATGTCCWDGSTSWCNAGGTDHQGYFYQAEGRCNYQ